MCRFIYINLDIGEITKIKWKREIKFKFSELEEECCQTSECVLEGVTFYVAYLGSCIVAKPSGEETTSQAVNTIVAMVNMEIWDEFDLKNVVGPKMWPEPGPIHDWSPQMNFISNNILLCIEIMILDICLNLTFLSWLFVLSNNMNYAKYLLTNSNDSKFYFYFNTIKVTFFQLSDILELISG